MRSLTGLFTAFILSTSLLLTSCTPLLVGSGIVAGSLVITDRRTKGTIADDHINEIAIATAIRLKYPQIIDLGQTTQIRGPAFRVASYNHQVLLVGIVENSTQKDEMEKIARRQNGVKHVYNFLQLKGDRNWIDITDDALITTQIKIALLTVPGLRANNVKVVTYGKTVYVMGLLTTEEQEKATEQIRVSPSVKRVVTLYETYPTTENR